MGPFDWLRGRRGVPIDPASWTVRREGADVVVEDADAALLARAAVSGVRTVRVVPLGAGAGHGGRSGSSAGWQITLRLDGGDLLVGKPIPEGQDALTFAYRLSAGAGAPVDPLSAAPFGPAANAAAAAAAPGRPETDATGDTAADDRDQWGPATRRVTPPARPPAAHLVAREPGGRG